MVPITIYHLKVFTLSVAFTVCFVLFVVERRQGMNLQSILWHMLWPQRIQHGLNTINSNPCITTTGLIMVRSCHS